MESLYELVNYLRAQNSPYKASLTGVFYLPSNAQAFKYTHYRKLHTYPRYMTRYDNFE
jgi:hypothetical protein